jgi:hypothetical protein
MKDLMRGERKVIIPIISLALVQKWQRRPFLGQITPLFSIMLMNGTLSRCGGITPEFWFETQSRHCVFGTPDRMSLQGMMTEKEVDLSMLSMTVQSLTHLLNVGATTTAKSRRQHVRKVTGGSPCRQPPPL